MLKIKHLFTAHTKPDTEKVPSPGLFYGTGVETAGDDVFPVFPLVAE